jgi:hypothetical protein
MALGLPRFLNLRTLNSELSAQNLVSVCSCLGARGLARNQAARQSPSYRPLVLCNIGNPLGACFVVRDVLL